MITSSSKWFQKLMGKILKENSKRTLHNEFGINRLLEMVTYNTEVYGGNILGLTFWKL